MLQLATQPGWFYTSQQSTNLTVWSYSTNSYANGTSLSWTNLIAPTDSQRFYRVSVNPPNPVVVTNYHSWNNVVSVNNGIVEALISPTDGRVQQFRFLGDTNGALWENSALYGQAPNNANGYNNFGGDKAWPSPQAAWGWPPPTGFDGSSDTVSFSNGVVTLVTPVDSTYNIQATRVIELLFDEPVMRVTTTFKRIGTSSMNGTLGVWIDCQSVVDSSSRCYVPVPALSIFRNGYTTTGSTYFTTQLPPNFIDTNKLISFSMPAAATRSWGSTAAPWCWWDQP